MPGLAQGSEIVVRLREHAGAPLAPRLTLTRPLEIVRVALGRAPREFLRMLPLLFPLCGQAHAVAGLRATESAAGVAAAPAHEKARRLVCLADAVAAHAWRCAFDWCALLGNPARPMEVAAARRAAEQLARALYPQGDLLTVGGGQLAPDPGLAAQWSPVFSAIVDNLALDEQLATLRRAMPAALAGADPTWMPRLQGRFVGIAAQARADAEALLAGLAAVVDAADPAIRSPAPLRDGEGEGRVDTARGELRYRVTLRGGRVADCALEAPIDRVFGEAGEAGRWLAALDQAQRPEAAVQWVVAAFDPCASVRIIAADSDDA